MERHLLEGAHVNAMKMQAQLTKEIIEPREVISAEAHEAWE